MGSQQTSRILFCPNCGAKNDDDAMFCRSCGGRLVEVAAPTLGSTLPPSGSIKDIVMNAFREAIALVRNPVGYMNQNKNQVVTTRWLLVNYVAILAAITFVGTLIGDLITFSAHGRYVYAIPGAILGYVLDVVGFVIVGMVIWKLASSFSTKTDQDTAMRLAAYSYTPVFLASIFYAIPAVGGILVFLALLYGLYILYRGMPILLSTPLDKVLSYVIVTIVVVLVISVVLSFAAGVVTAALR